MISLLFVYGTLLDDATEFGALLSKNSSFYKYGSFKGQLYDVGEYPGACYDPCEENDVYGKIVLVNNAFNTLPRLDEYEGFHINQPQSSEFLRTLVPIQTPDNVVICWVYLYNLPVNHMPRIFSGSYLNTL